MLSCSPCLMWSTWACERATLWARKLQNVRRSNVRMLCWSIQISYTCYLSKVYSSVTFDVSVMNIYAFILFYLVNSVHFWCSSSSLLRLHLLLLKQKLKVTSSKSVFIGNSDSSPLVLLSTCCDLARWLAWRMADDFSLVPELDSAGSAKKVEN